MVYLFDSWDKIIEPVTKDITYKAIYKAISATNSVLSLDSSTNLNEVLQSITEQNALSIELVDEDYELTIPTSTLMKMKNDNVEALNLDIVEDNGNYNFSIAANNDKDYQIAMLRGMLQETEKRLEEVITENRKIKMENK